MKWSNGVVPGLVALAIASVAQPAWAQATLEIVKKRGELRCGVNTGVAGFSAPDDKGRWTGFDVDFCRAVAATVFGDANRVSFIPMTAKERFTALQSGEIDVLSRQTTWTMSRDTSLGLSFSVVTYFDGQGFLVKKSTGVKAAKEFKGATVCLITGTTNELNFADFARTNKLDSKPVVFENVDQAIGALGSGRCDGFSSDASQLFSQRLKLAAPDDYMVLPDIISKEPLGPVVRQNDVAWLNLVKWTHYALLNAEELGITKANAATSLTSSNPDVRRLLGVEGEFGKALGLDKDWAFKAISAVGNYGEIYGANVGTGSPLKIDRGLNRLWKDGGLQYAPPVR